MAHIPEGDPRHCSLCKGRSDAEWKALAIAARARILAGKAEFGDGVLMFADCMALTPPAPSRSEEP